MTYTWCISHDDAEKLKTPASKEDLGSAVLHNFIIEVEADKIWQRPVIESVSRIFFSNSNHQADLKQLEAQDESYQQLSKTEREAAGQARATGKKDDLDKWKMIEKQLYSTFRELNNRALFVTFTGDELRHALTPEAVHQKTDQDRQPSQPVKNAGFFSALSSSFMSSGDHDGGRPRPGNSNGGK